MTRPRTRVLTFLAALLVVIGVAGAAGAIDDTQAAWTDKTHMSAVAAAGTWSAPTGNSCTAWAMGGAKLAACQVVAITMTGWTDGGKVVRNYYLNFTTSGGAEYVDFTVDLATATGSSPAMGWTTAGVRTGAQFTPTGGWTCASLPTITGRSTQWNTSTVYFQVVSSTAGESVMCS